MTQFIDRAEIPEATDFIRRKLSAFDLSKLDKLTLAARLQTRALNWRVKKPERTAKGSRTFKNQFEVYCSVNKDPKFPVDERDFEEMRASPDEASARCCTEFNGASLCIRMGRRVRTARRWISHAHSRYSCVLSDNSCNLFWGAPSRARS